MLAAIVALGLTFALATPALPWERVDLFDLDGRRTGYAIMDRETGRVDFYDVNSRRTGWGRLEASGRVERFDPRGNRQRETALPEGTSWRGK